MTQSAKLPRAATAKPPVARVRKRPDPTAQSAPAAEAPSQPAATGKLASLITLMSRPEGATIDAMKEMSGWQAHSIRGAISGSIKKKQGLTVTSEKTAAGRAYRIVTGVGA